MSDSDVAQVDYEWVQMFDAYIKHDGALYAGRGFTMREAIANARLATEPAPVVLFEPRGGSLSEVGPK